MNATQEEGQWRRVATVEVAADTANFEQLTVDGTLRFCSRTSAVASHGCLWYEILVNATEGRRRTARTAWAILSSLRNASDAGLLRGFRVVHGQHWLALDCDANAFADHDRDRQSGHAPIR